MDLGIYMFVQLYYMYKCNRRRFREEKKSNIAVARRVENVYYITGQNQHFAYAPYYKNKN